MKFTAKLPHIEVFFVVFEQAHEFIHEKCAWNRQKLTKMQMLMMVVATSDITSSGLVLINQSKTSCDIFTI